MRSGALIQCRRRVPAVDDVVLEAVELQVELLGNAALGETHVGDV